MDALDVIVRFHDIRRLGELDRCIYSLVTQEYGPLVINLVTQRFSGDELQELERALSRQLRLASQVTLRILNYTDAQPADARSTLLNLGISESNGRYLAFLDYDDTIYPESYRLLIERLSESGAAIAFGTVALKTIEVFDDLLLVESKKHPYRKSDVVSLFQNNFCPPNSYVLDRSKTDPRDLYFQPDWTKLEDYHFLIRICAKYVSDFRLSETIVGDYYVKTDGSNTTLTPFHQSDQAVAEWTQALQAIEDVKAATLVSERVQASLGLPVDPALTVCGLIEAQSQSSLPKSLRSLLAAARSAIAPGKGLPSPSKGAGPSIEK